jgi:hypothetical protein
MLSEINALSNQINTAAESGAKVQNKETSTSTNYSLQQQLSASYQEKSENGYTGVTLDLSNSVEMGVHEKTARMVIETNVRVSIESSFQNVEPSGSQAGNVGFGADAEGTAKNLIAFARKFMQGFMKGSGEAEGADEGEKTLVDFIDKLKGAADEGFENARQELAGSDGEMQEEIAAIFEQVRNYFEEYLKIFDSVQENNQPAETVETPEVEENSEAKETDESAVAEIAQENQRAVGNGSIPPGLQERFGL